MANLTELNYTELVPYIGAWSVLIVFVSNIFSRLSTKKMESKWKEQSDKNIAKLQSELTTNQALLNNIYNQYTSSFHLAQERRIKAIESFWDNLRSIRGITNRHATFIYDLLSEEEISTFWTTKSDNPLFKVHRDQINSTSIWTHQ